MKEKTRNILMAILNVIDVILTITLIKGFVNKTSKKDKR